MIDEILDATLLDRPIYRRYQVQLDTLPQEIRDKFASAGLIDRVARQTFGELWESYLQYCENIGHEPNTIKNKTTIKNKSIKYFGEDIDLSDLTEDILIKWHRYEVDHWAPATVAGDVKGLRSMVNWAMEREIISLSKNPFNMVERGTFVNHKNEKFVDREMMDRLFGVLPDQDWRTLIALCRYGGLRNPSETLPLRWSDIDFERGTIIINARKTKRYEGKELRIIPLFPELRPFLMDSFELSPPGFEFVINRHRDSECALRQAIMRYQELAGVDWPQPFHSLRRSRSDELFSEYPAHVAGYWMGQSLKVAQDHYLKPTPAQYAQAAQCNSNDQPSSEAIASTTFPKADFAANFDAIDHSNDLKRPQMIVK